MRRIRCLADGGRAGGLRILHLDSHACLMHLGSLLAPVQEGGDGNGELLSRFDCCVMAADGESDGCKHWKSYCAMTVANWPRRKDSYGLVLCVHVLVFGPPQIVADGGRCSLLGRCYQHFEPSDLACDAVLALLLESATTSHERLI